LLFFLTFEGERGDTFFFIFFKKKSWRGWGWGFFSSLFVTLLLFEFLCYFLFILKGEGRGWHGFYFSPFLLFLYCVLSFCIIFYSCRGRGCEFFFIF
jgi:succinate dehydrogenase hydrophobic anchor subunit